MAWKDGERMWATQLGRTDYQLENSPLYARGISYKDVVSAKSDDSGVLMFDRVVRHAGHSTYQVLLEPDVERSVFEQQWKELEKLGCTRKLEGS